MLNIKYILITCLIYSTLSITSLSAHKEYTDSIFHAQIANQQLKDSTLEDSLKYNLFEAKKLQAKGEHKEAINLLYKNQYLNQKLTHPDIFATTAYLLYQSLYAIEEYARAISEIKIAHEIVPNNTHYLKQLAQMEYGFKLYKDAIKHYIQLNKLKPYNSENIHYLHYLYSLNKQYKKALKELEKFQYLEGNSVFLLAERTSIYQKTGKIQKAEKEIKKYINKHPEDKIDATILLSQLYSTTKPNLTTQLLNQLNNEYPNNETIQTELINYYKNNNDSLYEKYTLDAIKTAIVNDKTAAEAIRPILSGYIQNNDTTTIHTILQILNNSYPNKTTILQLQADVYKAIKDTTNWRAKLYELRKITPNNETLDHELVSLTEDLGDYQEIQKLTKEGYNKYKNDKWAYFYIISFHLNKQQDSLITQANKLLPTITTPNYKSQIYNILGDIYTSQDNKNLAIAMYDSCLVYNPNNSNVLNNIAYNITKHPNPDLKKAEKMAAKALELSPESTYIIDTYAWILFLLGDNFLSEFYFDKLLRIEKENNNIPSIETLYHIGCLYHKTNRITEAKNIWQQALNNYNENPNNFNETEIIESIKQHLNNNE